MVATGKYRQFMPGLLATARRFVVGLDRVFVLADQRIEGEGVVWLPWGHLPWPYPTLMRYRAFTAYADVLGTADVLLYVDVDMLFVGDVDVRDANGLIAVEHPGFVGQEPESLPYERNSSSRAFVDLDEGSTYFAGGVQGGTTAVYLTAVASMASRVQLDLAEGIVPIWHDESVWNRWCVSSPPATVLPATYCTPEKQATAESRILALDKRHDAVRDIPIVDRLRRRSKRYLSLPRRMLRALLRPSRQP